MTSSAYMPDVQVEVAWSSGYGTAAADRVWTDVSSYVELEERIEIQHGRGDEFSSCDPNDLKLTLDNSDGRFTAGNTSGAYSPNVKIARPIRVRLRDSADGNLLSANQASMETSVADWESNTLFGTYTAAGSIAQSAVHAQDGTKSLLATWPTTAIGSWVDTIVSGLVIGRTYTLSAYVYVPAGSPDPRVEVAFTASSARTSTKDAWTRISVSFVATSGTHFMGVQVATATAGDTCYVDAVQLDEGASVRTFTTTAPSWSERFVGYVDEWPLEWDGTDNYAAATISATSRLARLDDKRGSVIREEYARDGLGAYYALSGLEESSGAGFASLVQVGTGAAVTFDGTGPATDSASAAVFTGGKRLEGEVSLAVNTATQDFWFEFTIRSTDGSTPGLGGIQGATSADTTELSLESTGEVGFVMGDGFNAGIITIDDNATHHVLVVGNDTDKVKLYVDGVFESSRVSASAPNINSTFTLVTIGDYTSGGGGPLTGTMSNVNFGVAPLGTITAARVADHATAVLDGFAGELPGARFSRYATYAGVPAAEVDTDTGASPMAHVATTDQTTIDLLRVVETTEGGVLCDARDNTLQFRARGGRYSAPTAFTLSMADQEVEAGLAPKVDRSTLLNDVTAALSDGSVSARAVDSTSVDDYGRRTDDLSLATTDVEEPFAAAWWRVNTYGEPLPRVPSVGVDLMPLDAATRALVLAADIGTRFGVSGIPSQAASSTGDYFVEGYTETIGPESYGFTFNVSDASAYVSTVILDDATRAELDAGNRIAY